MPHPRLYLLGTPRFEMGKSPAEMTAAKAVALLGYLAATPEPQTREHMLGLLWAESAEDAARKNLRNTLWSIRKALGEEVLTAAEDRLTLGDSVWADVRVFQESGDLALYRGPYLDGVVVADAPEFEIWLTGERERLAQLYARAAAAEVDRLRRAGEWRAMVAVAERAIAHDNLQEPMYRALMEAHARLGERAEALRQYDTLRAVLERELGVEPLAETEALKNSILTARQPDLISTPGDGGAPQGQPAKEPRRASRATRTPARDGAAAREPFVGRAQERAALDEEFAKALAGKARIALVTGEVGIGKSRLWGEWSAEIAARASVLTTRCLDSMQALPFAPLVELFGNPVLAQAQFTRNSPVSPVWLAEVARLLPQLRDRLPDLPHPAVLPPEEERRRLFEAFTQCLIALARPLVLFFDDIHWADRATLDWLDYMVHRMSDRALLLVAAYRPEDAPSTLVRLIANWGREGLVRRVPLDRLTPQESAALVAALGGSTAVAERLQAQSAGNPYFLIELSRAGTSDIPPALTELIRARLERLPETARQVLQAAAVLSPDFDFGTLRHTSGRSEEETLQALDALLDGYILTERDGHYAFAHPLIPAVVQGSMSTARRVFMHRRAAQALETTDVERLPQIAGQLAEHYAQAGDAPRAAHYADMAAERAVALAATDEAIHLYRMALDLEPTPARQMALGRVLLRAVELDKARAAFEAALRGFEASGDRQGAARAVLSMSETFFPAGKFREGRESILKALEYAESERDPESHALAHLALGTAAGGDTAASVEAERNLKAAVRHGKESDLPDIAGRASFMLGNLLAERGDLAAALKAYEDTTTFAHAAGNEYYEILGHNNYAYHALLLGDLNAAHDHIAAGLALAEARAFRLPLQYLYSTRAEIALAEEKWDAAEEWSRRALGEAEKNRNPREIANDRLNVARAVRGRGDMDNALVLLERAREEAAALADVHLQIKIELELAELFLERGERTAAKEALARAETRLAGGERKQLSEWARRLRARAAKTG